MFNVNIVHMIYIIRKVLRQGFVSSGHLSVQLSLILCPKWCPPLPLPAIFMGSFSVPSICLSFPVPLPQYLHYQSFSLCFTSQQGKSLHGPSSSISQMSYLSPSSGWLPRKGRPGGWPRINLELLLTMKLMAVMSQLSIPVINFHLLQQHGMSLGLGPLRGVRTSCRDPLSCARSPEDSHVT